MYKKKKEKKISSKFRRNLKSNLRKKISLQGSSILPASSMDYRANRSAKQCTWSLKKKKKSSRALRKWNERMSLPVLEA